MDSNHDKVIQSHLCYHYTTRQKEGKFEYHIVAKSQMAMTERMLRHDPAAGGTDHKLDVGSEPDWLPIPTILRHGCGNRRDNSCSGWFYWKLVDYVDKPTF